MTKAIIEILKENSKGKESSIWLLSTIMKISPGELLINKNKILKKSTYEKYKHCMHRRLKLKEPLQYIMEKAFFMDFELKVNKCVMIPRPETEYFIEIINNKFQKKDLNVLDIGTGSGAIAIALKRSNPSWNLYASDISKEALNIAKENTSLLEMTGKISFHEGDLLKPWIKKRNKIDLIVANLPYVDPEKEYVSEEVLHWEPSTSIYSKRNNPKINHAGAWEANTLLEQYFASNFRAEAIALELSESVANIIKNIWKTYPKIKEIEQLPDLNQQNRFLIIKINNG